MRSSPKQLYARVGRTTLQHLGCATTTPLGLATANLTGFSSTRNEE